MRHDGSPQTEYEISIVIATKDRSQLLDQMLTSLKQAMFGINAEVIVIDGDCSDNTRLVLDKHSITNIYKETEFLGT
jgi:glycosyltransferase involved in cell wall biosynthesis